MPYITSLDGISPALLIGFFVGWPNPPSACKHYELLKSSYKIVRALDEDANRQFGRRTAYEVIICWKDVEK